MYNFIYVYQLQQLLVFKMEYTVVKKFSLDFPLGCVQCTFCKLLWPFWSTNMDTRLCWCNRAILKQVHFLGRAERGEWEIQIETDGQTLNCRLI